MVFSPIQMSSSIRSTWTRPAERCSLARHVGLSLIKMARSWLEAEGVRVRGLSRDEIATRALHTTSDFPAILAGVTNRTLGAPSRLLKKPLARSAPR